MIKNNRFYILIITIFGFIQIGCSDVNFSSIPMGANQSKNEVPDYDDPGKTPTSPPPQYSKVDESFMQNALTSNKKLDILIVEDTSISMREERWTLHKKFPNLFNHLSNLDYQIGFTTTSDSIKGKLVSAPGSNRKVFSGDSQGQKDFSKTVSFDVCNDTDSGWLNAPCTLSDEKPLLSSINAFSNASSLFRGDANVAVLYITDTEEKDGKPGASTADDVLAAFKAKFGSTKKFKAYGILIQPGDTACYAQQRGIFTEPNGNYNHAVTELAQKTGGKTISICDGNYDSVLSDVEDDFDFVGSHQLFSSIVLKHIPLEGSLKITFDDPNVNIQWRLEGRTVFFSDVPPQGVKINVSYLK